jgi:hypothetical protein
LIIALLVGLVVGGAAAFTSPAAAAQVVTTTYPTVCGRMLCTFPLPSTWPYSVQYEGVTCTLPGVTCPTAVSGRAAKDGAFVEAVHFSGAASVAATTAVTLTTPGPFTNSTNGQVFPGAQFVYNGAAGFKPDTVTFTIDRAASTQSLLALGGTATMSVYLDDLTDGTSLTVVNERPIADSSAFATDPTVSVDPNQLTMGHTYNARVVTKLSQPVGAVPDTTVYYRNFALTATGTAPVVDTPMISSEALGWLAVAALIVAGGVVAIRRRRVIA